MIRLFGVGVVSVFLSILVSAQDSEAVLKRVNEHYNHLSSLKTHFSQRYAGMGLDREESGTLLLRKPGKMRWDYAVPAGKVFILDGKFAWSYTPGDVQVERLKTKQLNDLRSPLRFLLGHTDLERELSNINITPIHGGYEISGVARGIDRKTSTVSLETSTLGDIRRILITEEGGETTEFKFDHPEENLILPDSLFHYSPPSGVTVVEGLPPL